MREGGRESGRAEGTEGLMELVLLLGEDLLLAGGDGVEGREELGLPRPQHRQLLPEDVPDLLLHLHRAFPCLLLPG